MKGAAHQQPLGEVLLIDDLSRHGIDHLLCPVCREVGYGRLLSDQAGPSHTVFLTVPVLRGEIKSLAHVSLELPEDEIDVWDAEALAATRDDPAPRGDR